MTRCDFVHRSLYCVSTVHATSLSFCSANRIVKFGFELQQQGTEAMQGLRVKAHIQQYADKEIHEVA